MLGEVRRELRERNVSVLSLRPFLGPIHKHFWTIMASLSNIALSIEESLRQFESLNKSTT
jgi:hypothetical protein